MLKPTSISSQKGITLIEALVALVITAVGILGVVGVQLRSLADTQTGIRRAQAVRLVEDLSERLKVNPNALAVLDLYKKDWGKPAANPTACDTGCASDALAKQDLATWYSQVQAALPLADAATFVVADESGSATRRQLGVMISWRENERRREGDKDAEHQSYRTPLSAVDTGKSAVECPSDRICHLQYIHPTARCTVGVMGGPASNTLHCPAALTP